MFNNTLLILFLVFSLSFIIHFLLIALFRKDPFCNDCEVKSKPQKVHRVSTPRAGGVGIFASFALGALFLVEDAVVVNPGAISGTIAPLHFSLVLVSFPAFFSGLYEDMRGTMGPRLRLVFMAIGAVAAITLLDATIYDIGLFRLPVWVAVPFTIFSLVGVTNAINIIDGFNGLAAGISILIFSAFAVISYFYGDTLLFALNMLLIAATAGFLFWNFPRGRIFLGDGGAYLIGFLFAVLSVLLVKRNDEVSPWFPLVILAYPIFEVLFSIYRRKLKKGLSSFGADGIHLHTLLYKRYIKSNPKTSVYLWIPSAFFIAVALPYHRSTLVLIFVFFTFAAFYVYVYRRIVRFSFPVLLGGRRRINEKKEPVLKTDVPDKTKARNRAV
ncbi:MAG: undecaprenyl/decaprenyl-phosphate alpha-N-acetylglucosaminyl 1-phosphate transferase [Alphaproteobacteria bacterium]|uniref:Undecaprenyl/decaprenyl-phosphate alpha-N-acetylglucosaminyl 1-phosphate transferase n=1 Tax=Candidatus Nitrobium versatile TaxID=2884831 RepID=A0A953SHS8_9BACT|nr:undecaprenyl/decaprenyl-phosphate alpha-N-acetylglucosaminyl 1-phosphate transferase [Candidatus Nitrobium versatile]